MLTWIPNKVQKIFGKLCVTNVVKHEADVVKNPVESILIIYDMLFLLVFFISTTCFFASLCP